jgi:hypothetical protein
MFDYMSERVCISVTADRRSTCGISLPTLGRDGVMFWCVLTISKGSPGAVQVEIAMAVLSQPFVGYGRPFLLPRAKALLLRPFILLSLVGDVGLDNESLPERAVCELFDD